MVSETRRDLIIIVIAGVFFLFSSLILSYLSPTFSSPDETANAFFTETLVNQGKLFSFEPLNTVLGNVLFPRSIVSVEARLLPISFLGLPILLAGLIKIFGAWSLPFWTPFLALLAVLAWYGIIKQLFNRQIGLLSSLLLMFFPAWWYWSARPLMHNVVFVCFLVFGVFFLVVRPIEFLKEKIGWLDFVLAGWCLGFSVWLRTFEVFWLGFSLILGLLFLRKYLAWRPVVLFFISLVVAVVPLFFLNNSLYGSPFKNGYTIEVSGIVLVDNETNGNVSTVAENNSDVNLSADVEVKDYSPLRTVLNIVAPFGLHLRTTIKNFYHYFICLFWWLIIPAAIGLYFIWPRRADKNEKRVKRWFYLILTASTILWLGSVYGSWSIFDNPDVGAVTIGNSYTRYWLPGFVLLTPLIATAIYRLGLVFKSLKIRILVSVFCVLVLLGANIYSVFFASEDSLWPMRIRTVEAAGIHNRVLQLTESNSVIIVDRADKLFFPDRRVRYPLRDETTYTLMPQIVAQVPLYYYGITLPEIDVNYLNTEKLKTLGLQIKFVENFGEESLYRIYLSE